jgi:hypothetical protein
MFEPIWRKQTELHIWGPASPVASLEERIATYFSPPLFPVHLSEVPASIEYHDASESEWQIDGARFSSNAIIHPGPTVGYRIESKGRVLAYLTDHEPALGADLDRDPSEWISGFAIARGADLLIHDCQFTPDEYEHRLGWGRSTTEQVARVRQGRSTAARSCDRYSDEQLTRCARRRRRPLGRRRRLHTAYAELPRSSFEATRSGAVAQRDQETPSDQASGGPTPRVLRSERLL